MITDRIRLASFLATAAAASLAAACSGSGEPADGVEVRDSAGVVLVHSSRPRWEGGDEWSIASEPDLVIGERKGEGPYLLHLTGRAHRLPNGGVLITQRAADELRLFDSTGRHVRSMGGTGDGPGEFRSVATTCLRGDTVSAYDVARGRLTAYTLDGELVGSRPLTPLDEAQRLRLPVWFSSFADCDRLGRPNNPMADRSGHTTFAYWRLELDDLSLDTVTVVEWRDAPGRNHAREEGGPLLFWSFPRAVAGDSTVYVSDDAAFHVEEFARDGRLLRRFGRAYDPVPITDDDIARYHAFQLGQRVAHTDPSALRQAQESARYADSWRAHTQMVVDAAGNLWLRHFVRPWEEPAEDVWTVYDPDGVWLGEVRTPSALWVTEIGDDYVLGVWRDELDVESVRLFRLTKPRGEKGGG